MDHFYTVQEIADMLGLEPITIRRWIYNRILKAYKLGREHRIKKSDFNQFLEERKTAE